MGFFLIVGEIDIALRCPSPMAVGVGYLAVAELLVVGITHEHRSVLLLSNEIVLGVKTDSQTMIVGIAASSDDLCWIACLQLFLSSVARPGCLAERVGRDSSFCCFCRRFSFNSFVSLISSSFTDVVSFSAEISVTADDISASACIVVTAKLVSIS